VWIQGLNVRFGVWSEMEDCDSFLTTNAPQLVWMQGLNVKFRVSSEMEDRNSWRSRILSLHTYPTMRNAVHKFKQEVMAATASR
jgi:hypothetical protein